MRLSGVRLPGWLSQFWEVFKTQEEKRLIPVPEVETRVNGVKATVKLTLEAEKVLRDIPQKWFGTQDYDSRRGDLIYRLGEELRLIAQPNAVHMAVKYMLKDLVVWEMCLKMPHAGLDTALFVCSMRNKALESMGRITYAEVENAMGKGVADKLGEKILEIIIDVDKDYDGTYDGTETAAKGRWSEA